MKQKNLIKSVFSMQGAKNVPQTISAMVAEFCTASSSKVALFLSTHRYEIGLETSTSNTSTSPTSPQIMVHPNPYLITLQLQYTFVHLVVSSDIQRNLQINPSKSPTSVVEFANMCKNACICHISFFDQSGDAEKLETCTTVKEEIHNHLTCIKVCT